MMNKNKILIAPSLLAADFSNLANEIKKVEDAGCDMLHLDVMDGHFVPNITIGPFIVKAIRKVSKTPLDAHLMIENPQNYINDFVAAGADSITVHAEACPTNLGAVIDQIHSKNIQCGVSIKPATSLDVLKNYLDKIDLVLIMTVNPGFGGQSFMPEMLPKIEQLRKKFAKNIQVDGGINKDTCQSVVRAGANVLVAGTAIFGKPDIKKAIEELRCHQ